MGRVILADARCRVALIAPRDIDDPKLGGQNKIDEVNRAVIVFHPGYHRGVEAVQFPYDSSMVASSPRRPHANELDDSQQTTAITLEEEPTPLAIEVAILDRATNPDE